jgi:pimeloyl-ACP methyl ester carboxylesterase
MGGHTTGPPSSARSPEDAQVALERTAAHGANSTAGMANARLEILRDAGHLQYGDWPDAVADAINGFLRRSGLSAPLVVQTCP